MLAEMLRSVQSERRKRPLVKEIHPKKLQRNGQMATPSRRKRSQRLKMVWMSTNLRRRKALRKMARPRKRSSRNEMRIDIRVLLFYSVSCIILIQ